MMRVENCWLTQQKIQEKTLISIGLTQVPKQGLEKENCN
jgi:hypothetical protein